ncbi:hypothetical protein BDF20DRAFT_839860 [Mycotypha africana]|uniref:uncharacterized protein n=1 Tax=Mycotypha africana TaxID=64632 RepID=UPI002300EB88|nr:uncharacterized protein BDF20DRAFT_839860 [Mycotypha africana]KAI8968037.1 hypothetical protein BDF20DRAFT_839860 [Mycotypha africana]
MSSNSHIHIYPISTYFNLDGNIACTQFCLPEENDLLEDDSLVVAQHLTQEQFQFEFPPKHRLQELAYLDTLEDEYSFFDPCSFTTTVYSPAEITRANYLIYNNNNNTAWHDTINEEGEEDEEKAQIIDDSRLSPLQLPAQVDKKAAAAVNHLLTTEKPVGPASFLSHAQNDHMYPKQVAQSEMQRQENDMHRVNANNMLKDDVEEDYNNLRVYYNESVPIMDPDFDSCTDSSSSVRTTESRIVLIKLNKLVKPPHSTTASNFQPLQQQPLITYIINDEGYIDGDIEEEEELESKCVFYPLSAEEEALDDLSAIQNEAATKIQAVWRGYCSRRQNHRHFTPFNVSQQAILNLAGLCSRFHHRQVSAVNDRLKQLQQQLREETAMRTAFEKAMEDMTVLIDQQQKALYDRLEKEEQARHLYEEKLSAAFAHIDKLEQRLEAEVKTRNKLEDMVTRTLCQMQETESLKCKQAIEDAELRRKMQAKIDKLTEAAANSTRKPQTTSKTNIRTTNAIVSKTSSLKTADVFEANNTTTVRRSVIPATNKITSTTNTSTTKLPNGNNTRRITRTNLNNTFSSMNTVKSLTKKSNNIASSSSSSSSSNKSKQYTREASVLAQQKRRTTATSTTKRTLVPSKK